MNKMFDMIMSKKKAVEVASRLTRAGPTKQNHEYDSDEEIDPAVGTWEHANRIHEMELTREWAETLTEMNKGKHHIGDFLPPEELKKFTETYEALKEGREPDRSDYKQFKISCDNIGFKMLEKMGWSEGEGLGSEAQGRTVPVNQGRVSTDKKGLGTGQVENLMEGDNEFDAYRKRMMLAYRFRPNPLNNPRRTYY